MPFKSPFAALLIASFMLFGVTSFSVTKVKSIKDTHARLIKEGVEVTEIKQGIKEDTLVATIKSHTNNVPTLLIEQLNK